MESMASSFLMGESRGHVTFEQDELDQRFLQCTVCYDKFDQRTRIPKILPSCHHTFCQSCLQELLNAVRPNTSAVAHRYQGYVRYTAGNQASNTLYPLSCPACRQISSLNTRNAHTLQTDYKVIDMVEFFGKNRKNKKSLCGTHQQPLNFFCEKCMVPICRDCTVLDHKERDGHNYLDIKDAFHRFEDTLKMQVDDTQELEKRYECREDSLKLQLQEISDTQMQSEQALDHFFDECMRQIEDRRADLRDELNNAVENERTNLQENLEVVIAKREMLQDKASALDAGINCGNLHEAFSIHKELRDHTPALKVDTGRDDGVRIVRFTPTNQDELKRMVLNLGRVVQPPPAGWTRTADSPPPADRISVGTNTSNRCVSTSVDVMDQSVSTMSLSGGDERFM